ncbi:hypothetical protein Leryth_011615 [Lithospermum erythrorhizon]|nr:hypothetical protein Leryth_011615 [Lithospermum erythrorhizon]
MAAAASSSMLFSFLLFVGVLSLQFLYKGTLASSELFTILGGFTSSLIFLFLLTFIGNYQETSGTRPGWGAVIFAEAIVSIKKHKFTEFALLLAFYSLLHCCMR